MIDFKYYYVAFIWLMVYNLWLAAMKNRIQKKDKEKEEEEGKQ